MGESLSKVLSSTTPTTNLVEGEEDMSSENLVENSTEVNEENSSVEGNNGEVLKPENSSRLAIISGENEIEPDDDLVWYNLKKYIWS